MVNEGMSRRNFIALGSATIASLAVPSIAKSLTRQIEAQEKESSLDRKEHFKPFNEGYAEWQYVEFQHVNEQGKKVGVTISVSELTDLLGKKTQQFLVSSHNLETRESNSHIYNGERLFDEATSTYTFVSEEEDTKGQQLMEFSYNETEENYAIKVNTTQFDSDNIDPDGLILNPQGDLIPVSKDGNFTVASYEGGSVITKYTADNIIVSKSDGKIVGYGRRDSENLDIEGGFPTSPLDIDHYWIHVASELPNGDIAFITAWQSKTGGDYKFADISVVNPTTGEQTVFLQFNEDDPNFDLQFIPKQGELEDIEGKDHQMAHGGQVIATLNGENLLDLTIDGNPGQVIDSKGFLQMVEAHGELTSGSVLGTNITDSKSAIWESTDERYSQLLPIVFNNSNS